MVAEVIPHRSVIEQMAHERAPVPMFALTNPATTADEAIRAPGAVGLVRRRLGVQFLAEGDDVGDSTWQTIAARTTKLIDSTAVRREGARRPGGRSAVFGRTCRVGGAARTPRGEWPGTAGRPASMVDMRSGRTRT